MFNATFNIKGHTLQSAFLAEENSQCKVIIVMQKMLAYSPPKPPHFASDGKRFGEH